MTGSQEVVGSSPIFSTNINRHLQHYFAVDAFYIYSVPLSGIELIKFYFSICVAAAESKNNFALGCLRNIEAGQFSEIGPFKA